MPPQRTYEETIAAANSNGYTPGEFHERHRQTGLERFEDSTKKSNDRILRSWVAYVNFFLPLSISMP